MKANIPGASTALARKSPSVPMRYLWKAGCILGPRTLDYGCGRGRDAETYCMDKYDPAHHPVAPQGKYQTITCNYVLNVVPASTQWAILSNIASLLEKNGRAYITVRRDLPENGAPGRGCYQRNVSLPFSIALKEHTRQNITKLRETSTYCIYEMRHA